MDKKVIFAVAGAGKTTHIVNSLSAEKRSLILTYTIANEENLRRKIIEKFGGRWPESITLMRYFSFLFRFCYRPFLSDDVRAKGIIYENNPNRFAKKTNMGYYLSPGGYFYSNRLSMFVLERAGVLDDIKKRISRYFDELIIDEIQDIAGRDFTLLENLMETDINQLFVGDFFQHTYDTSLDGNVNKSLFDNRAAYEKHFRDKGFVCDTTTLVNSWRCSPSVCQYIMDNLGIEIHSNRPLCEDTEIRLVNDPAEIDLIFEDQDIVKLHYQKAATFGIGHRNWGETKGEDHYKDVCVLLNKNTAKEYSKENLKGLVPRTKNKLYVAISRARGNVYLINE